jgi:H+-transporting ATPase
VIGAVPIALPLVMQVTMAIGAKTMASKKAIITHLTALQEIASMTVLCSDKTGTLTTADMRVTPSEIWTMGEYSKDDALIWSGVASNPANKEDPIDSSVLKSCVEHFGERECEAKLAVQEEQIHRFQSDDQAYCRVL